jgi:putative FmdB family regulatory protein
VPLYEYECPKCGRFEVIRKFSDPPLKKCPTCGKTIQKLASAPAIQFKGAGWYVTDYAKKSSGGDAPAKGDGKEGSSTKSDSSKGDSAKPESSTTAAPTESSGAKPVKAKDKGSAGGKASK